MARAQAQDAVFDALSDPTRRELLALVGKHEGTTATELARALPVTRQAVSKHLSVLSSAGLVDSGRSGREVRYRLTPEPLSEAMAWMAGVGAQWDARLARLQRQLSR